MLKKIILSLVSAVVACGLYADLKTELSFSTDNGKTWVEDFPILKKTRTFMLKVSYSYEESRPLEQPVTSSILSHERDFASANRGKLGKEWIQRLKQYYKGARSGNFIYTVDLGKRKKGNDGLNDKTKLLPPLDAHSRGNYRFMAETYYVVKANGNVPRQVIRDNQTFYVEIEE